jgi:hypothetical protein
MSKIITCCPKVGYKRRLLLPEQLGLKIKQALDAADCA